MKSAEKEEIKGCPFCGVPGLLRECDDGAGGWRYKVECFNDATFCEAGSGFWTTKEEAVSGWNRRACPSIESRIVFRYGTDDDHPIAFAFDDRTKIRIARDGMRAWLEIVPVPIVTTQPVPFTVEKEDESL